MNTKTVPFTAEQLENIIAQYPTPFHIYDEEGIIENMKSFINAFSWNKGFKQYFAVKATPNPYIMRVLQKLGVGADCSSLAELMLCEKVGITGHDIMFTSNDTPYVEYKKALDMGAIINLDDITHIEYLEKHHGSLPDTFCVRYNPGSLKEGGNTIIGLPEEAKYGMTREQIFEAYKQLQAKGVKHFGIHTMVVSNELDIDGLVGTAELCFNLAVDIKNELGINVEFIDLGGGVGVAYKPEQTPVDFKALSKGVEEAYNRILVANGLSNVALAVQTGIAITKGMNLYVAHKVIPRPAEGLVEAFNEDFKEQSAKVSVEIEPVKAVVKEESTKVVKDDAKDGSKENSKAEGAEEKKSSLDEKAVKVLNEIVSTIIDPKDSKKVVTKKAPPKKSAKKK